MIQAAWQSDNVVLCQERVLCYFNTRIMECQTNWLWLVIQSGGSCSFLSYSIGFFSNLSDKCKSTSPSAIQVKSWWKTVSMEDKLDIISQLGEGEQIVDMCCNVWLSHTKSVCVAGLPPCYRNELYQKSWTWISYIFIAIEINILFRNACILYKNVYILYIHYIYALQVHVSTSGIVIHYIGWVSIP